MEPAGVYNQTSSAAAKWEITTANKDNTDFTLILKFHT